MAVARQSGEAWYVGALTNWDKRALTLDFSFLPAGKWKVTVFQDGVNAEKEPCDYTVKKMTVMSGDKLDIGMASGGGWFAKIER